MKPLVVRMLGSLLAHIRTDLERPHPIAAERVGFVFTREGDGAHSKIALVTDYVALDDDDYIDADTLAAVTFRGEAIRRVRQRILETGEGAFHVHAHPHRGVPRLSKVDLISLSEIVRSFAVLQSSVHHGAIVSSDDALAVTTWDARGTPRAASIEIVGYPMSHWSP